MTYSKRGRTARAELTEAAVRGIRSESALGATVRQLAEKYDIGFETIRRILRWETWRWVEEEGPGYVPPPLDRAALAASEARLVKIAKAAGAYSKVPKAASTDHAAGQAQVNAGERVDAELPYKGSVGAQATGSNRQAGYKPVPAAPHISLEELLKQTALREEAQGSLGLERLAKEAGKPNSLLEELTGQLDTNEVCSDNPGGESPTSDGG